MIKKKKHYADPLNEWPNLKAFIGYILYGPVFETIDI